MSLPATDNFNRASLGTNWTKGPLANSLAIWQSVKVASAGTGDGMAFWNADLPNAAQYAQCIPVADPLDGGWFGPTVRSSATDCIMLQGWGGNKWDVEWYNGGAWTVIGNVYNAAPVRLEPARIEANGTSITAYINGVSRITGSNAGIPSTGYGGIYSSYSNWFLDDFEVGNLGGAVASLFPPKRNRPYIRM